MIAIVENNIIRDRKVWVRSGEYQVVRRFDDYRWIILLANPRHPTERTITLVSGSDITLRT